LEGRDVNEFRYERAATAPNAVGAALGEERARYVAGGTNILDLMKISVEHPSLLVDINRLPLAQIERRGGSVYVGALARMSDVAANGLVRQAVPMVALALEQSASPQLRNMASMGGNLLQRTRCPYFRDVATPCNKRAPGSGCGAIGGENRMEAVLGTSEHCIATHASDVAVALMALDAVVHVTGRRGDREIRLGDFYRLPGATPQIETTLLHGELIIGIEIPAPAFAVRSTYLKVRDRAQYEFALASAALAVDVDGGVIRQARIALGGVGTIPWRSPEAEGALAGAAVSRDSFAAAAEAALRGARGHGRNDYKITLAKRTLVRALEMVTG
jgi:xanthine dehydrogenase YagS FAD-binding subunit